jgi:acyl carrier protein
MMAGMAEQQVVDTLRALHPEHDFTRDQRLLDEGIIDSFDVTIVVADLDQKFGISIDGADIVPEHFATIAAIVELLMKYGVT